MTTRAGVVDAARKCIGTPFFHCGRQPGLGLDCIGLLIAAYETLNARDYDVAAYSRIVPPGFTRQKLSEMFDICPTTTSIDPGDVLLFTIRGVEQHVAIASGDDMIIHAYQSVGKVVEHRMDDWWRRHLSAICKYRGPRWQV